MTGTLTDVAMRFSNSVFLILAVVAFIYFLLHIFELRNAQHKHKCWDEFYEQWTFIK